LSPAEVLSQLNGELFKKFSGRFVTCSYMIIDTEKRNLIVSGAGHHPFLLFRQGLGQVAEKGGSQGVPLGLKETTSYQDNQVKLEGADRIVLFTDGILEARNRQAADFGMDKLKETLSAYKDSPAGELLARIKERIMQFCIGTAQHDDITLIIVSCDG
jgi:sigma-B regulation protein RsbU (phosphoserine phosphatase)